MPPAKGGGMEIIMKLKLAKRASKLKKIKKIVTISMLRVSFIIFVFIMLSITYQKSKHIMYTKSLIGKLLVEKYFDSEILPQINLQQKHSEKDIYELIISMNNEILLNKYINNYDKYKKEEITNSEINPSFAFSSLDHGSSAFKSNFWKISNALEFVDEKSPNIFENLVCNFLDLSYPETMVLLYEISNEDRSDFWSDSEELILYGNMYEDSVFRILAVDFIKNRNINTNEFTLVTEVVFDKTYKKNNLQKVICKKENIQQYYINKPLTIRDVRNGYKSMFQAYGFSNNNNNIFEDNFSILETICIGRFPITDSFNITNDLSGQIVQSREYMYIYFSFSPIIEAMKVLYPLYIVGACLILFICYIVSDSLCKKISNPLKVLPKMLKKGVTHFEFNSEIEEFSELSKELNIIRKEGIK